MPLENQIENMEAQMPWQPWSVTQTSGAFSTLPLAGSIVLWERINLKLTAQLKQLEIF